MSKYEMLEEKKKKKLRKLLYDAAVENLRKKMLGDNYYEYLIEIQNLISVTDLTDEELKKTIDIVIAIMEELKVINNTGKNRSRMRESMEEKNGGEMEKVFMIWNWLKTEILENLVVEMDKIQRVAGAYALMLANPQFISGIVAAYDMQCDKFDDEELYSMSAYFLLRTAMCMHGREI